MKPFIYTCSSVGTCIAGLALYVLPILQVVAVLMSITLSYLGLKTYFENKRAKK
jgi:hypothetical protein